MIESQGINLFANFRIHENPYLDKIDLALTIF